jgi:hypothetical protein
MKRKLETDADSQCLGHDKIIKFQESQIISLKARYRNANIAVLNQKIKRQTETIVRLKDEIRSLKAVKKETFVMPETLTVCVSFQLSLH